MENGKINSTLFDLLTRLDSEIFVRVTLPGGNIIEGCPLDILKQLELFQVRSMVSDLLISGITYITVDSYDEY